MDSILQPPQRDQDGLPILPPDRRQPSDEEITNIGNSAGTPDFFSSLGLPIPPFISEEEVRRQARKWSKDILADHHTLREILQRHEETIRKRWVRKTKGQRKTILLKAWPNMSVSHRPDYDAFRKETDQSRAEGTKFRDAYLWPSIDLEDLTQNRSFLLLVNSRGRHSPQVFAHADAEMGHMGHVSRAILPAFLNMYTMYLDDSSVENYGRLVSWDDDDEAMQAVMSRLAYQPGEGLLILEVQQRILSFLIECCHTILHDIDSKSILNDLYSVKPEPPSIVDPADYSSLAALAAEAPYRVPAQIDFYRLRNILFAKRSEAEDHIWALREDPGYFADSLKEWGEHHQLMVPNLDGTLSPELRKPSFWDEIIRGVVIDAYGAQAVWDILCNNLLELASLQEKYRKEILPGKKLPDEYLRSLLTFRYALDQLAKGPIQTLKTGLPASPPFRNQFIRQPSQTNPMKANLVSRPGVGGKDPLFWIFMTLWDDQKLFLCGLPDLMDELERLVQADPIQKNRLTAWVSNVIADLGVVARARHEVDIYFPWAAGFDYYYAQHSDAIEGAFNEQLKSLSKIPENFRGTVLAKFGDPSDGKFNYPSDKKRTQKTTNDMRKAEGNLDAFWKAADLHYQKRGGRPRINTRLSILESRQLERTPEWIEPIKPTKSTVSKTNEQKTADSFSHLSISQPESPFEAPIEKVKAKTRGDALPQDESNDLDNLPEEPSDTQPTFQVNNRAFKVFKTLFHSPFQSDLPGETPWTDFLYAMAATGFIPEKLYGTLHSPLIFTRNVWLRERADSNVGSVWQFTPTTLDVERSIQFHEPHPRSKIPFQHARRIGRRLNRAYGWTGSIFVLE